MIEVNENEKREGTGATKPTTEHLATEVLEHEQEKRKAKNLGMAIIGILAVSILIASMIERMHLVEKNYKNDCDWRKLFSEYDFVSQDGNGINSANYGKQGDLNNGAENKVKEKQGNR